MDCPQRLVPLVGLLRGGSGTQTDRSRSMTPPEVRIEPGELVVSEWPRELVADTILTRGANRECDGVADGRPEVVGQPLELLVRVRVDPHARGMHAIRHTHPTNRVEVIEVIEHEVGRLTASGRAALEQCADRRRRRVRDPSRRTWCHPVVTRGEWRIEARGQSRAVGRPSQAHTQQPPPALRRPRRTPSRWPSTHTPGA